MIYRCVAVDDEPLALDIIEDYIRKIEYLELVARCTSAIEAVSLVNREQVDILFLDIQMPDLSGFEMLESLNSPPRVIFTTAYENYAVKSYNIDAIDYLLKPFSFARFFRSIEKVVAILASGQSQVIKVDNESNDYVFVSVGGKTTRIMLSDILYIKGLSDYIEIVLSNRKMIVYETLKHVSEQLTGEEFMRVHKSYIVPIGKIDTITGDTLQVAATEIPIGRTYRKSLIEKVEQRRIGR
jgi:DNA-binding LytR/AlgR family response regulator